MSYPHHPEARHRLEWGHGGWIDGERSSHLRSQTPSIRIWVSRHDEPGSNVAGDGDGHQADRTGPGHQHVFPDEVERQSCMGGIAERVQNRAVFVVDMIRQREHVAGRQGHVVGECTGPFDA